MNQLELCKMAMANAANALGRLIGHEVAVQEPRLRPLPEAEPERRQATGVRLEVLGSLGGTLLLLVPQQAVPVMLELLVGEQGEHGEPLSELQRSALEEVGNIMASAFLNSVSQILKMSLLTTVPRLVYGEAGALLSEAGAFQGSAEGLLALEMPFSVGGSCRGSLFLVAAANDLDAMRRS